MCSWCTDHSEQLIVPQSLFWTCPIALQSRDGNTEPSSGCWHRQKSPKIGHSTNIKLEDAANIRNNLAFAGKGDQMGFSTSDSVPRAVGQWVGEEPGLENDPPQKSLFLVASVITPVVQLVGWIGKPAFPLVIQLFRQPMSI